MLIRAAEDLPRKKGILMRSSVKRRVGWVVVFGTALLLGEVGLPASGVLAGSGFDAGKRGVSAAQGAETEGARGSMLEGAEAPGRLFALPGLSRVGRVAAGIYRGAMPRPEGYATLAKMGVRSVINLRSRNEEKEQVEAHGMRSFGVPMSAFGEVNPERVRKAVALMADPANQPVFVHCQQGRDRTGVVVAVYRMEVDGWSREKAEEEMQAYGFHDVWFRMKSFIRRYRPGSGSGGEPTKGEREE
jgi:tyrosine-protein phosphatase SIW14